MSDALNTIKRGEIIAYCTHAQASPAAESRMKRVPGLTCGVPGAPDQEEIHWVKLCMGCYTKIDGDFNRLSEVLIVGHAPWPYNDEALRSAVQ